MFPPEVLVEILKYFTYSQYIQFRLINKYINSIINEHKDFHLTIKSNESYLFSQSVENIIFLSISHLDFSIISKIESLVSSGKLKELRLTNGYPKVNELLLTRIEINEIEKLVVKFPVLSSPTKIHVPNSLRIRKLDLDCFQSQVEDFLLSKASIDKITIRRDNCVQGALDGNRKVHCLKVKVPHIFVIEQKLFSYIEYLIIDIKESKTISETLMISTKIKNLIIKMKSLIANKGVTIFTRDKVENITILFESESATLNIKIEGKITNVHIFARQYCMKTMGKIETLHTFSNFFDMDLSYGGSIGNHNQEEINTSNYHEKKEQFCNMYTKAKPLVPSKKRNFS